VHSCCSWIGTRYVSIQVPGSGMIQIGYPVLRGRFACRQALSSYPTRCHVSGTYRAVACLKCAAKVEASVAPAGVAGSPRRRHQGRPGGQGHGDLPVAHLHSRCTAAPLFRGPCCSTEVKQALPSFRQDFLRPSCKRSCSCPRGSVLRPRLQAPEALLRKNDGGPIWPRGRTPEAAP